MKKDIVLFDFLKGILFSVLITVLGVAALALFVKDVNAPTNTVSIISVVIKVISVVAGVIFTSVKVRKKGWATGAVIGAVYWAACLALSALNGGITFSLGMILDFLLTCAIGVFAGILTVNALK